MINIHCTKKMFNALSLNELGQLKSKTKNSIIDEISQEGITPLNHWHGHYILIQRSPCLFLLHDATRFPLFIPNIKKSELGNLDYHFNDALMNTLLKLGADNVLMDKAHSMIHRLYFDFDTNRSVQGSMNQMIQELRWHLADIEVRDLLGYSINVYFSDRPCSIKGYKDMIFPQRAMMDLLVSNLSN